MTYSESLDDIFKRLGVKAYTKIGEGRKASFYLTIAEYKQELRLTLYTVNEQSLWIGGRYSIPIELAPQLFGKIGYLLRTLKKYEVDVKNEQRSNKQNNKPS